jgi:CHAT domain-containing protein
MNPRRNRWSIVITVAVIAVVLFGIVAMVRSHQHAATPAEQLVEAAAGWRPIDGRLTGGFHWTVQKSAPGTIRQRAVAAGLVQQLGDRIEPDALRMSAAAQLLVNQRSNALAKLEQAARMFPNDARVWSDLATTRLSVALEEHRAADLPLALAAADRAIELDPMLPEGRFNRAAILERLGLHAQARDEWKQYLGRDASGDWSIEARRRLRKVPPAADWKVALAEALARGPDASRAFVAAHPQEARTWAEGFLVYQWALAEEQHDSATAAKFLGQIRTIGSLIAERGDQLLVDSIAAVDRTARDPATRRTLVQAYLAYGTGRGQYGKEKFREAEQSLGRAAELFRKAHSPMASVSEYFAANTVFSQTRVQEAREMLARLDDSVDAARHPTLAAQIVWELALCDSYEGAMGSCMSRVRKAHAIFEQQGEATNRAFVSAILAEAYDRTARVEEGWEYRVGALPVLSDLTDRSRLAAVLAGAIRAESYRHQYGSAIALAAVAIDESVKNGTAHLITEARTRQAIVFAEAGARERAMQALGNARADAAKIEDEQLRARAIADTNVVEASLTRTSSPERAIALFTDAIDLYTRVHHETWLPQARLERGRAYRGMGDTAHALEDFEAGIREIERQRSTIQQTDVRSTFFDTAPDLFAEAVDLLIARGDAAAAYSMAERARARTLYEQLGITAPSPRIDSAAEVRQRLGPEEVLIEYQILPNGLGIFCLDRDSITVVRTNIDLARLRSTTAELVDSIRNGRSPIARRAAAEAWRLLIAPVADRIAHAERLIIVPDRFLHAIPFPALFDTSSRQYLIQRHELVLSPGGSFGGGSTRTFDSSPALIIGDPTAGTGADPRLAHAELEARAIARLYGVTPLVGDAATVEAVIEQASKSRLIHYAGHAQSASDRDENRLMTLDASDIARLRLSNNSLVVLAACGALRGNTDRVEGIPSLARAFMAAGVPTVVGTLWDVPDESSASLFLEFHQQLKQGKRPAAALRNAQLAALRSNDRTNMTWAILAIIGRD